MEENIKVGISRKRKSPFFGIYIFFKRSLIPSRRGWSSPRRIV